MSREKNLIKNTAIISLGTFFPKFIAILITPILTARLTNAEYGTLDLIITIVSLLLPAVTLQISSAAFRFLIDSRKDQDSIRKIVSTILSFIIIITSITCVIFYFVSKRLIPVARLWATLYLAFDIVLIAFQQIVRGLGNNLHYSISCMIRSITDTLFVAILLGVFGGTNFGINGALVSLVLACFLSSSYLFFAGKIACYINVKSASIKVLKKLIAYSWPMVPNNLSGWVLRLSDRVVITAALGIEANSIYAAATKMPTIFSSVQDTFSLAWQENASLASNDTDKDFYYSKMCDEVFSFLTGLMAILIMSTPIIWSLLIRGNYQAAYFQLPVLYMGMYFSCLSLTIGGIYIAHKKTKNVGITTVIAAFINLIVDLLLVKAIGIWAGSISTLISYIFLFSFRMRDIQKFQRIVFKNNKIVLSVCLLSVMCLFNYFNSMIFNFANVIMCVLILVVFERDMFLFFLNVLKRRFGK